ncbi:MAG: hypothetical protein MSH49_06205 [[Eubacterium] saphenum]|nr:hypothetical protein [[Eubacterium] saphenum]
MADIVTVFTYKNQKLSQRSALQSLQNLHPADRFAKKKAAGSLGGSSRWKFIKFDPNTKDFTRIR